MSELTTLVLEPDNPCNASLIDRATGKTLYTVVTEHEPTTTYVRDTTNGGEVVASWAWRDVRSDVLTLGKAPPGPANAWLRTSLMPFKHTVTFKDDQGREFKWKNMEAGGEMELFAISDKTHPIAAYQKALRYMSHKTNPPTLVVREATLSIDARGVEIMNLVVVSFLHLEKERRMKETSEAVMSSTTAAQVVTVTPRDVQ